MSKLITFYKKTLDGVGLEVDDEGLISRKAIAELPSRPVTVEGKRLCLPTEHYLTAANVDGFIAFHPLSENIARGQSPVLKYLVKHIRAKLTCEIASLMTQLVTIACNKDYQSRLPSVWDDFFRAVAGADDKTEKNFTRMMSEVLERQTGILSIFLKNGGKLNGADYIRVCHANFKIVEEIKSRAPYGVSIRVKDVEVFLQILRYILPDIEEADAYSVGVNYDTAPYFSALMKCFGNIATKLNETILLLKAIDEEENEKIPTSFIKDLDGLGSLRKIVPPLPGNEGQAVKGAEEESEAEDGKAKDTSEPPWDKEKESVPEKKTNAFKRDPVVRNTTTETRRDTKEGVALSDVLNAGRGYTRRSRFDREEPTSRRDERQDGVSFRDIIGSGRAPERRGFNSYSRGGREERSYSRRGRDDRGYGGRSTRGSSRNSFRR